MAKTALISFLRKNRLEVFLLLAILITSLALRLYNIDGFLTFLGDEGRDVRIVRDLLHGNLVFIGPQTSVGNMYLGPLYYYLIAPSLLLANFNPVGPAIFNAFLGTLTVGLTWFVGRRWFGSSAGLTAALLFALSPVAIIYSRTSWNPNPMPLFALLTIWSLYQVRHTQKPQYLLLTATSYAFALQMHYLALLMAPIIAIYYLKSYETSKGFIKYSLLSSLLFLFLMFPLVLFDLKHSFLNLRAFLAFFFTSGSSLSSLNLMDHLLFIKSQMVRDLVFASQAFPAFPLAIILEPLIIIFYLKSKNETRANLNLLLLWILTAVIGLGLYHKPVYIHYFGFIYPAIYLLLGYLLTHSKFIALPCILLFIYLSLNFSPVRGTPNYLLRRTQTIVDQVISKSGNTPFNFGLIAKQNYDESYRYFFENKGSLLVRGETGITDQLFVVCEDAPCEPANDPAWQIAIFGEKHVVDEWQVEGVKVFRLLHNQTK